MVWSRHFAQALLHARDVPPGAGGFAELVVPEPGTYPMVTHRLADAARGASGLLVADPA